MNSDENQDSTVEDETLQVDTTPAETSDGQPTAEANTESAEPTDPEVQEARAAFDADQADAELATPADAEYEDVDDDLADVALPFVGQWNSLISTTNWEKGKIISEWRAALIEKEAPSTEYSDEAWAQRVGGVTAPHVGRLRRVFDRFADTFGSYTGLYWSHFLAALDWDDAPLWLEGASKEKWSISGMRQQRWQAHGAVESQRPTDSQIVEVELDEESMLASQSESQDDKKREFENDPGNVASGPVYEAPDFGEEEELTTLGGAADDASGSVKLEEQPVQADPVQPFAGLPELPEDLQDVIEQLKLSLLRHKATGWETVKHETVEKYLEAMIVLAKA